MGRSNRNISYTYNLGGVNRYVVRTQRGLTILYYEFLANTELEVLNFLAKYFNSRAYVIKEQGVKRIVLLNDPNLGIYFEK